MYQTAEKGPPRVLDDNARDRARRLFALLAIIAVLTAAYLFAVEGVKRRFIRRHPVGPPARRGSAITGA
jgi:hypothetical protein